MFEVYPTDIHKVIFFNFMFSYQPFLQLPPSNPLFRVSIQHQFKYINDAI